MRILIAEDLEITRLILERALQNLGHEVVATADGEEAWRAYQAEDFPMLITDWQMPYLDGVELCRRVRAAPRRRYTYILLLTALESRPEYMEAIDAGADDFLTKPIDNDLLAARLRVAERIGGLLTDMHQMQALLPLCPACRRVCDEHGHWTRLEQYAAARLPAAPNRCPQCQAEHHEAEQKVQQLRQQWRRNV